MSFGLSNVTSIKLINVHQNKNLKTSNKEKAGRGQRPHYLTVRP